MRERIRLTDLLARENAATQEASRAAHELARATTILDVRLQRGQEELRHEQELCRQSEDELSSLRQEMGHESASARRLVGYDDEHGIEDIQERLGALRHRMSGRPRKER